MKAEVTVCNVCREIGRDTTQYVVERGKIRVVVDLCQEDAFPLERLLAEATQIEPQQHVEPRRRRARRAGGTPIMTMAEIEAAKRSPKE